MNHDAGGHRQWKNPLGLGSHAVLMGKEAINEPFAVINADDFYGQESFEILANFLKSVEGKKNEYCMVGYRVGNTLSESGAVSRGVCVVDEKGYLQNVVERTHIEEKGGTIYYQNENGDEVSLHPDTPVSMNMELGHSQYLSGYKSGTGFALH